MSKWFQLANESQLVHRRHFIILWIYFVALFKFCVFLIAFRYLHLKSWRIFISRPFSEYLDFNSSVPVVPSHLVFRELKTGFPQFPLLLTYGEEGHRLSYNRFFSSRTTLDVSNPLSLMNPYLLVTLGFSASLALSIHNLTWADILLSVTLCVNK